MLYKTLITSLLLTGVLTAKAQDSLKPKTAYPAKKSELGISVITPAIMVLGATDFNERYTNLTYRYFLSEKHTIKPFVGMSFFPPPSLGYPRSVSAANSSTVYMMSNATTPTNFQVGVGYEYVLGGRRLKHLIGADLLYNNKFTREEILYYRETDSVDVNGKVGKVTTPIDTGRSVKTNNYDKIGLNLHYTIRYEVSKRWLITASAIMSNKYYIRTSKNGQASNFDANFIGLVSDISIFFRF